FTEPIPILALKAEYVGAENISLTWAVSNAASNSYTYRMEVASGTSVRNLTSNVTKAEITELTPGTLYNFTVFAIANDDETEGGVSIRLYTKPSPVLDLKAEYVGVTSVNLTWMVNDATSNSYTYRIEVMSGTSVRNLTSNVTKAEITELIPGTLYDFTVFAVAADGQTEGEGLSISLYTSNGTSVRNLTSNVTKAEITELIPGTLYDFTVFAVAADGQTEGEGLSISLYTSKSQLL
ncbi:PTPRJ phosphatase, partial [Haliaeetus albicilla]|nr:PTPRJ phosphatase [Haliaeetus albicilla]